MEKIFLCDLPGVIPFWRNEGPICYSDPVNVITPGASDTESENRRGEAKMLMRQLQRRFGELPTWASEKLAKAKPPSLEEWGLRILDAQSLDAVFADRTGR